MQILAGYTAPEYPHYSKLTLHCVLPPWLHCVV